VDSAPDDSELAERSARGERAAFEALVERHVESLFRFATLSCGTAQAAERAVREALLSAWQERPTRTDSSPRIWLLKHVRLACRASRPASARLGTGEFLALPPPEPRSQSQEEPPAGGLTCGEALARVSDFIDGELAPLERAQVEAHLRACERCAKLGSSMRLVVESLRRLGEPMEHR
jgi:DNA-directed RNA polymerase specialized sigma24 family protein